jgi:hypothetical protein
MTEDEHVSRGEKENSSRSVKEYYINIIASTSKNDLNANVNKNKVFFIKH